MASSNLLAFAGAIAQGDIDVVDLTRTLTPEFPTIVMPPELGQFSTFPHGEGLALRRARQARLGCR
ncbi:hypothetical protein [Reyranella soli]|uniref:Uncharacterized protein n=1 Tax=Reyranella soli TaxID=1230389 RepID=A0A512NKD8_9HYPH|nr:hypothetical protein [Reyranella soli]GEP59411.1 hypothetical protein RSO01_65770 [Reyranella soli]